MLIVKVFGYTFRGGNRGLLWKEEFTLEFWKGLDSAVDTLEENSYFLE